MITACKHYEDGRQIPCPPQCPSQMWPHSMFRLSWLGFGKQWKLRRQYREPLENRTGMDFAPVADEPLTEEWPLKPEPDLVVFLRRLIYLEKQDELTLRELHELNGLRRRLHEDWPAVSDAVAAAYAGMS